MSYSPALSITSDMTDEELDQYFANYVPLSNLPTPPPAKEQDDVAILAEPISPSLAVQTQSPTLKAHATHLANLIPLNVSTSRPCVSVICGFLERACLADEIVAFAACILDALSYRFTATWRDTLIPSDYARDLHRFLKTDTIHHTPVSPDVIVLAALSLAHGFLTDRLRSSRHWAVRESNEQFTVQEIEATKRSILQDMDYGLCRINDEMVQRMLRDMQRAKVAPMPTCSDMSTVAKSNRRRNFSIDLPGTAVWKHGVQTPEPSP